MGQNLYLNSEIGISNEQTTVDLPQVAKPLLYMDGLATWTDVANESGYRVQLYKDGAVVASASVDVAADTVGIDLLSYIQANGPGSYRVAVTALGTGLYLNGPQSPMSDAVVAGPLAQVARPWWDLEMGAFARWTEIDGADEYEIKLYFVDADSVTPDELLHTATVSAVVSTIDLTDYIVDNGPGIYYVTVQAKGTGITSDGPVSEKSTLVVFVGLGVVNGGIAPAANGGSYEVEAFLSDLGINLRFTSMEWFVGELDIDRYGSSSYAAPGSKTAAGMFVDMEWLELWGLGDGLPEFFTGSILTRLQINYLAGELPANMPESSLVLYRYREKLDQWELVTDQGVTPGSPSYVWANLDGFSTFGVYGQVTSTTQKPLPKTIGYLPYLALLGLVLSAIGLLARRKRLADR
jgi:hypothetical protein